MTTNNIDLLQSQSRLPPSNESAEVYVSTLGCRRLRTRSYSKINDSSVYTYTNYAMNIIKRKTPGQKIEASTRPTQYVKKTAGGIVLTFNAAVYELFQNAVASYYQIHPAFTVKIKPTRTADGLHEQDSLSISPSSGNSSFRMVKAPTSSLNITTKLSHAFRTLDPMTLSANQISEKFRSYLLENSRDNVDHACVPTIAESFLDSATTSHQPDLDRILDADTYIDSYMFHPNHWQWPIPRVQQLSMLVTCGLYWHFIWRCYGLGLIIFFKTQFVGGFDQINRLFNGFVTQ